jgi:hypothetical protein
MVTLKHLVEAHDGGPGPYLESWPKYVFLFIVIQPGLDVDGGE